MSRNDGAPTAETGRSDQIYRPQRRNVNWIQNGSSGETNDMYWNDPASYDGNNLISSLPPPPHPPNLSLIARTSLNRRQHLPNCPCEHEAYDNHQQQHQKSHQHHLHSTSHRQHNLPNQHPLHFHQHQQQQYRQQNDQSPPYDQRQQTFDKDLFESKKRIRNIRIVLGVVLTVVIIGLISSFVIFLVGSDDSNSEGLDSSESTGKGIQLEDVLTGKFQARRFNGTWSTGSNILFKDNSNITEYDVVTGKHSVLMQDENHQYVTYQKSADGKYLLLARNHVKLFRHSFQALYEVLDLQTRQIHPLTIKGSHKPLLFAIWSSVDNGLVINYERNLFYKSTALADETPLTNDENPAYLNGIPDWVYEEEVFSSNIAVWFNANGTRLAFIRFDDTPTRVIKIPIYGEAGDLRFQYPFNRPVAYPKAGSPNPNVQLFTVDLLRAERNSEFLTEIPRPSPLNTETDYIITVVEWLDNDNVLSVWMNRVQNLAYLQVFDGLRRNEIYHLESKTGWVDLFTEPFKNRDGSQIALILPQLQGDDGYFRHLCLLSTKSAYGSPIAITKGRFVVQSVLHWDPLRNIIFYTANMEEQSQVLHVFALKAIAGSDQQPQCLTCKLQMSGDIEQSYYSADFNTGSQIVITSSGPGIPMHIVYEWSYANNKVSLRKLVDWETNENLRTELSKFSLPQTEIHTIPIADGLTAKVLLHLPPNLDRSGKTKYPMLVDVYGGPDSYSVVDKWTLDWGTYLTSNQSVIYAKIDGRGSGLRGDKLLHSIYLKLGTVEIQDQIEVTRTLQRRLAFIDEKHTGIWGWSYGGYAAAMALANDNSGVFECAASIAPVTDWAYYDSIYTERYMGLLEENRLGYDRARLSTQAYKFKGKKFLLIHGTLDDNVHYQQAMILAKNLERNDILFKQISYPDEDHGLAGVRPHLYHSLDKFFGECFGIKRLNKWGRK